MNSVDENPLVSVSVCWSSICIIITGLPADLSTVQERCGITNYRGPPGSDLMFQLF